MFERFKPIPGRDLRVGYGRIFHEANVFSPSRTAMGDFDRVHHLAGAALAAATTLRGTELKSFMPHAELTGFRQAARLAGGVQCVPLSSALAVPSGPLTRACFDALVDELLTAIAGAGALDGVYLALHGSMQVDGLGEPPEAHILRRVRAALGAEAKLAVSYDLHANLSAGLVDPVDVLVAYRSNPHWDLAPTGFRAGRRLIDALRGRSSPAHAWRKLPMTLGGGTTVSFLAPMRGVFRDLKRLEDDPRVISASLFMVHPYTDAAPIGWAVHVCTDGDPALAERLAEGFADRLWRVRNDALPPMLDASAAIAAARESPWRKVGPVTFVDVDDVVGAGAPGGNTRLLAALAREGADLKAYVPLHDPAAVDALWDAPEGSAREVVLQGTPGYEMPAVTLSVKVGPRAVGDSGRALRLDAGALRVVVTDGPPLPIHPSFWSAVGLSARDADVLVQKNFFHYRMFYATVSFHHLPVVSAGATDLRRVRDADYLVPMSPRARLDDWRPYDPTLRAPPAAPAASPLDATTP
ncbi:MAG: M81 family metallopeptidase [Polyangiales bacterium]